MKHRKSTKALALFLSLIMVLSTVSVMASAIGEYVETDGRYLISNTQTNIVPGVVENKIVTNDASGTAQAVAYAVTVDMNNSALALKAGYADNGVGKGNGNWEMQTVRQQAAKYEASPETEGTVVAAVNADIYNMANGEPMGVCILDGKVLQKGLGRPYFGVDREGNTYIGDSLDQATFDKLYNAVSGFFMIVKDGKRCGPAVTPNPNYFVPRTVVGVKEDGTVMIVTVDGRNFPISNGLDEYELASICIGLGLKNVLNLDGGGSTTYLARHEGEEYLTLKDKPSDGHERAVSSSLFVVTTAMPTGEFDHAAISPANNLYTPSAEIQFTAAGVDPSGATAPLPEDGTFALVDSSMGTITPDGKFVASGKTGTVEVNYISGGKVAGTASVEIVKPDSISFANEEVSLGFEAVSDLGLTVKYQQRDVIYTPADIKWEITNPELGTITNNLFTSSDGKSLRGNVFATSAYDELVSSSVLVVVGLLPTVVWDFEDVDVTDDDGNVLSTIPAEEYYTGTNGILTHSNYGRGGKESIEIVSIDDDEPVRFGSHALKLNYDFINCGAVTEGACVGTTGDKMEIPGNPTGIGCWVYAPEGAGITYEGPGTQAGFWLRGYFLDGAGNSQAYDFTLEPKQVLDANGNWTGIQPGVSWEGWMYCEASLAKYTGPFAIQRGMTFRLMYVYGTKMGTNSANSLYFDNLQFVYGTNVDDVDNPVVGSVTLNGTELENGAVIDTNTVSIDAMFYDVENKYTTGIDAGTVRMYVDGVNVSDNDAFQYAADPDGSKNHLYNEYLLNGEHSVTVSVRDNFGNETSETRYFTIAGEEAATPTVSVKPLEETAVLGKTVNISIDASDASVMTSSTGLGFGGQFKDYTVTFGENFDGTYSYNKLTKTLTVSAENKGGSDTHVATVSFKIPADLNANQNFNYTVKSGAYTVDGELYTYSADEVKLGVSAPYTITAEPMIVGTPGTIVVTDSEGNKVQGVTVYYGTTVVGVTDENGEVVTEMFTQTAGNYEVYAKDNAGDVSFVLNIGSYDVNGESNEPFGLMNNAVKDPTTMKAVNWFTSVKAPAQVLQYKVQGADEWTTVEAKADLHTFTKGGNSAAVINGVTLTGLTSGTTYEYRVGSEDAYSEVLTFKTAEKTDATKFFVLGDMQSEDITNISAITDVLANGNYDFGIQTGDMVDDTTEYSSWVDVTRLLGVSELGSVDTVHVLGNHEYAGDATAEKSKSLYSLQDSKAGGYYSVEYGNVYVAVINYSGNVKEYREALNWVVEDAKASDATWKVLSLHQPPYFTNVGGGNTDVHALVPAAVEEAGINVVFSGHDHSYARTPALKGGEPSEDGSVYFICGSSGEKKYSIGVEEGKVFDIATQDYDGVYLSVETTKHTFAVKTYNVDGSLLDSYTLYSECQRNGHKWTHDSASDSIVCTVCGDVNTTYTGFITDEATGKNMYYLAGTKHTGWLTYGEEGDFYYFDENGLAVSGELTIPVTRTNEAEPKTENIKFKFDQNGLQVGYVLHKDSDGNTRCYRGGRYVTGWVNINGDLYFFTSTSGQRNGAMYTGTRTINLATGEKYTYTWSSTGKLLKGCFYDFQDGTVYYWGGDLVFGWQEIEGKTYYFDPITGFMAKGDVIVDDELCAFSNDGVLLHKGEHVDENGDGKCDICTGSSSDSASGLAGIFKRITSWFQRIIDFIRNLFK